MEKIILASASPRRRELLTQIGISFTIQKAEKEETVTTSVPSEAVKELALQKAREVAEKYPADVVIGADTIVAANGQILGKPKDAEDAIQMLRMLQGGSHEVITGVAILLNNGEKLINFAETTRVHVFPMTEEQICSYVESGEPMDRAGSYGIQGTFAAYISGIA